MNNLNEKDIQAMLKDVDGSKTPAQTEATGENDSTTVRQVLVIGCGDGGCNISTLITDRVPHDVFTIAYNTSIHNMRDNVLANKKAHISGEDGSGKVRDYSKNIFKNGTYETVIGYVNDGIESLKGVDYVLITTTADGGTGSGMSVILAKLLSDNLKLPVIVLGVYPTMDDDAQSQFNALEWQSELTKAKIPHFILDNNIPHQQSTETGDSKVAEVHNKVNEQAARIAALLTGTNFGTSTKGMIDRRNLLNLTMGIGGRMVATSDTTRPTAGQTLDDYIENMLQKSCQPLPMGATGIGVWVKGPKDMLAQMNTDLHELQSKYGEAQLKFAHIEESTATEIGIIMTGCNEASDRLAGMKHRYDDIMSRAQKKESCIDGLMSGMTNPMGGLNKKFGGTDVISGSGELDTSAFDL
ncbi:MAG: hypothetical protein NC489_08770 [Ruminococcus flavefaciens]|nr:hypothetical protein [Ruminococcus flavefaciens]